MKRMKSSLGGLKGAVAGLIGAAALGSLANNIRQSADDIGKLSTALGIGTGAIQRLRYAAQLGGTDIGAFDQSLRKFATVTGDAKQGLKEAVDGFNNLGVSFTDVNGKILPLNELLLRVSDGFMKIKGSGEEAAIVTDLFGRAGVKMLPFLIQGREAIEGAGRALEAYGGVIDRDGIKTTEEFNDRLTLLKNSALEMFAPVIKLANDALDPFFEAAERAAMPLPKLLEEIQKQLNVYDDLRKNGKAVTTSIRGLTGEIKVQIKSQKLVRKEAEKNFQVLAKERDVIRDQIKVIKKRILEEANAIKMQKARSEEIRIQENYVNSLAEAQARLMEENAIYEAKALETLKANNAEKKAIQKATRKEEMQAARALAASLEEQNKKMRDSMFKDDETYFYSKNKLEEKAFLATMSTMESMASSVKDEGIELFRFWQAAAIANTWMSTHEAAMKAWAQLGVFGGFAAAAIYVLGAAQISKIVNEKPPGKQAGGDIMAGQPYLVGEQGPELFTPGQMGSIAPNRNSEQAVIVNIYDGTGQRISEYDSAIRVDVQTKAERMGMPKVAELFAA